MFSPLKRRMVRTVLTNCYPSGHKYLIDNLLPLRSFHDLEKVAEVLA